MELAEMEQADRAVPCVDMAWGDLSVARFTLYLVVAHVPLCVFNLYLSHPMDCCFRTLCFVYALLCIKSIVILALLKTYVDCFCVCPNKTHFLNQILISPSFLTAL